MTQLMPLVEPSSHRLSLSFGDATLDGTLTVPGEARGVLIFAQNSGSSRLSLRNRAAARRLNEAGFATLLVDLLTVGEEAEHTPAGRHSDRLALLSYRLLAATDRLGEYPEAEDLPLGYFAVGLGTAAALLAAAHRPDLVGAIVSCGGLPDLASARLADVAAPTLLIVGQADHALITRSQATLPFLPCDSALALLPGSHAQCERHGNLGAALPLAVRWYERFLG